MSNWIKPWSASESIIFLTGLSHRCKDLGGPLTAELCDLVDAKRFEDLARYNFDYVAAKAHSISDLRYARQIQGLFSKQAYIDIGVNKRAEALRVFFAAEGKCLETNNRLRTELPKSGVASILYMAQRKISSILGHLPNPDELDFSFGPGVTTSTKQDSTFPRGKLSSRLECTESLIPFVGNLLAEAPMWAQLHSHAESDDSYMVNVSVSFGKLATVPKTSLTDRCIVVEPILNSFYQKGFGKVIRERLFREGVDLNDQTYNQRLACLGSIDGSLATIDLSSASDTLANGLVWSLLPFEWACALSLGRSESILVDGELMRLHKFSSMGNAYTFELESLIFYALAHATCTHLGINHFNQHLNVYGDDIIVPSDAFALLSEVLEYCGFSVNLKKSYASGPFRESCGADYFGGFDIRPFYQKDLISERHLYVMHNWFVRHAEHELAEYVYGFTDPLLRLTGPDGYGDGHLVASYQLRRNRSLERKGWGGGYFDTYALKPRLRKDALPGDAILPVYSIYVSDGESLQDHNAIRGNSGYHKLSIYTLATSVFRRS